MNRHSNPTIEPRPILTELGGLIVRARPALALSHLWFYALPLLFSTGSPNLAYLIGGVYVCLPLGLLIYGWNDWADTDVDQRSSRKNHPPTAALFGRCLRNSERAALPRIIVAAQLPFIFGFGLTLGIWAWIWILVMVALNAIYNGLGLQVSRRPVAAEATALAIYLLIVPLAEGLLGVTWNPCAWLLALVSTLVMQVTGAWVDLQADRSVHKKTLMVAAGERWCRPIVLAVLFTKVLVCLAIGAPLAAGYTCISVVCAWTGFRVFRWHDTNTLYVTCLVTDWLWMMTAYSTGLL